MNMSMSIVEEIESVFVETLATVILQNNFTSFVEMTEYRRGWLDGYSRGWIQMTGKTLLSWWPLPTRTLRGAASN